MSARPIGTSRSLRSYSDGHPVSSAGDDAARSLSPQSVLALLQAINAEHTPEQRTRLQLTSMIVCLGLPCSRERDLND